MHGLGFVACDERPMWGRGSSGTKLQPPLNNNRRSTPWSRSILPTLVPIRRFQRRTEDGLIYSARGNLGVRPNLMDGDICHPENFQVNRASGPEQSDRRSTCAGILAPRSWRQGAGRHRYASGPRRGTNNVGFFKLAVASPIFGSGCGIGRGPVGCKLGQ